MYFWKTKALSEDIKNDKLSDNDWKNYYLVVLIVMGPLMLVAMASAAISINATLINAILSIVIIFFGVNKTFKTHNVNGNSPSRYIQNMIALTVPLTIKFYILSLFSGFFIGGFVIAIISSGSSIDPEQALEWLSCVVAAPAIQVLMFWRYNVHIQNINS